MRDICLVYTYNLGYTMSVPGDLFVRHHNMSNIVFQDSCATRVGVRVDARGYALRIP